MIYIIPTSAAEHLLGSDPGLTPILPGKNREGKRYFPDGEVYLKLPQGAKFTKGAKLLVLYSGSPQPNDGLVELELILQILKDKELSSEVFFSYFPYGMQDKVFEKGEINVARSLAHKLVNYYQVKKIYIIDPHFGGQNWVRKYPIISVSAIPLLIEKARRDFGPDILFLSPDKGGKRRTGIFGIKKERLDSFRVKMFSPKLDLEGKIIGVVDDIIETGGTLLKFYEIVKKAGAKKVIALITHGLLSSGISKIKKKYSKLYLANTVNQKEANVDITGLIFKTISGNSNPDRSDRPDYQGR